MQETCRRRAKPVLRSSTPRLAGCLPWASSRGWGKRRSAPGLYWKRGVGGGGRFEGVKGRWGGMAGCRMPDASPGRAAGVGVTGAQQSPPPTPESLLHSTTFHGDPQGLQFCENTQKVLRPHRHNSRTFSLSLSLSHIRTHTHTVTHSQEPWVHLLKVWTQTRCAGCAVRHRGHDTHSRTIWELQQTTTKQQRRKDKETAHELQGSPSRLLFCAKRKNAGKQSARRPCGWPWRPYKALLLLAGPALHPVQPKHAGQSMYRIQEHRIQDGDTVARMLWSTGDVQPATATYTNRMG